MGADRPLVTLQDPPQPASANVLSEHEIEALDGMPPQGQAELLLERSINHYRARTNRSPRASPAGAAKITLDERLNNLFVTAINSDDLTVRVAGIEIDIAARNREGLGDRRSPRADRAVRRAGAARQRAVGPRR